LSDGVGLSGLWGLDCLAGAEAGRARIVIARRKVRIPPF
jgi:hypothetical protein